ncbi:heat shock transcription factor, Y-linked-like [Hylaeus anthracinus]|uniref:heat shock transcription factor, Y-linked-like n=1 Tax=Hylaeus anthracinus TaxID=313031 RepID=UPI0023B8B8F5|nr:heat shock transcription factor, Y-linked-like [Hylaeus anthracinus]
MFDDCIFLSLRFPQKLWRIVNECKSGAIQWSLNGTTILLDYKKFQKQYLDASNSVFKTRNITSFIRQLNLYGFRKVTSHNRDPICNSHNPNVHEFLHENFRSGRSDLLSRVYRKTAGKLKHCQRIGLRSVTEPDLLSKSNDHVSRLQMCRLALTKALQQITEEYRRTHNQASKNKDSLCNTMASYRKVFGSNLYATRNQETNIQWITNNTMPISPKKDISNGYTAYPWCVREMDKSRGKY